MKRIITLVLAVVIAISGITVPTKQASADELPPAPNFAMEYPDGSYVQYEDNKLVYYRDADGNVIVDERVFEAEILGVKVITEGFSEKLDCLVCRSICTNVTWSSSNTSIATVDQNGLVTSKKPGKVTITATILENKQKVTQQITIESANQLPPTPDFSMTYPDGSCVQYEDNKLIYYRDADGNVIVDKRVFDAYIQGETVITEGYSEKLDCMIVCSSTPATWSSGNTSIATVDQNGLVTGKKLGKVTITATIPINGQKVTKEITIAKNQSVSKSSEGKAYQRTDSVSYDKKGNLVWTIKIKNASKKKYLYIMGAQDFDFSKGLPALKKNYHIDHAYNKKYKFYGQKSDLMFTLKPNKSKTIKITMKKSKLSKKYHNVDLRKIEGSSAWSQVIYYKWSTVKKARKTGKQLGKWTVLFT